MPCRDPFPDEYRNRDMEVLQKQKTFLEAALCAVLTNLEHVYTATENQGNFLEHIDFTEAGITKEELVKWRAAHVKKDTVRREKERKERVRKDALKKLSKEEKEILGICD